MSAEPAEPTASNEPPPIYTAPPWGNRAGCCTPKGVVTMRSNILHCVYVPLVAICLLAAVVQAQGPSPAEQAAQSGLPMLREFMLKPGDRLPFSYQYTAQVDGPHRMIAVWGTVIPIKMAVSAENQDPIVQQGNPATVTFTATKGTMYNIAVIGVGDLPVASVGQLYGGPDNAVPPPAQPAQPLQPVQPIQPGQPAQPATPVIVNPILIPAVVPQANPPALTAAAPVSREAVLGALMANPDTRSSLEQAGLTMGLTPSQLISQGMDTLPVPGGGKTAVMLPLRITGSQIEVNLPKSPEEFNWKSGVRLSPLVNGPKYRKAGKVQSLARWMIRGMCTVHEEPLSTLFEKGLIALAFNMLLGVEDTSVGMNFDLPQAAGTYLVTVHLTDSDGRSAASWAKPPDPAKPDFRMIQVKGGLSQNDIPPWLTLAPLAGEKGGYATIISVPDGWGGTALMMSSWLGFGGDAHGPVLFGGYTIMRLKGG